MMFALLLNGYVGGRHEKFFEVFIYNEWPVFDSDSILSIPFWHSIQARSGFYTV